MAFPDASQMGKLVGKCSIKAAQNRMGLGGSTAAPTIAFPISKPPLMGSVLAAPSPRNRAREGEEGREGGRERDRERQLSD